MVTTATTRSETAARPEGARPAHLPKRIESEPNGLTDDEILGISAAERGSLSSTPKDANVRNQLNGETAEESNAGSNAEGNVSKEETKGSVTEPEALQGLLEANPDLRQAWNDARAYREAFATPEEARKAIALIADLNRMDALFFSARPEDHVELARSIADLNPNSFASLVKAMGVEAAKRGQDRNRPSEPGQPGGEYARDQQMQTSEVRAAQPANVSTTGLSPAQTDFFQATNAAAVQSVVDAIQTQVERLMPEGASKNTRNRVAGEIYREIDETLRENRQLAEQVRDAFRSGALDASHQRAIVSLITGRARQALPYIAKKVMSEWTSTVLAANQNRRTRQRAAEHRVDIAGSGGAANDGRRSTTPRDIDYARMSDADILNL